MKINLAALKLKVVLARALNYMNRMNLYIKSKLDIEFIQEDWHLFYQENCVFDS